MEKTLIQQRIEDLVTNGRGYNDCPEIFRPLALGGWNTCLVVYVGAYGNDRAYGVKSTPGFRMTNHTGTGDNRSKFRE